MSINDLANNYIVKLSDTLINYNWSNVDLLANELSQAKKKKCKVFLCGNGGSAGNAIHIANDFVYGVAKKTGQGIRAIAFTENQSVITCLANDLGYEFIFSEQLALHGDSEDLLIVLSGSGNSTNLVNVLKQAKSMEIRSFAILGYDGGLCKDLADVSIHFPINDMQIAEDTQLIVGHILMQKLYKEFVK